MFRSREYQQNQDNPQVVFSEKRRQFFSKFLRNQTESLSFHREHGLLEKRKTWNEANGEYDSISEDWSNVTEHCLVEAVDADTLADMLELDTISRQKLVQGAMLHDFYKRKEIEAMRKDPIMQYELISEMVAKQNSILLEGGVDPEVVGIAESVGMSSFEKIERGQATELEKIMNYIDDITLDTDIKNLSERIAFGRKRYSNIPPEQFDRQLAVSKEIQQQLAKRLEIENPDELPHVIRKKIFERIEQEQIEK